MKDSPLKRFWRVIYPLALYLLIQFIVVLAAEMISFLTLTAQNAAAGTDPDIISMMEQVAEIITKYSYEITVISAVLTLPFLILFYYMDKKRKKQEGVYQVYSKIPVWQYLLAAGLGFSICIAGNNIITFSRLTALSDGYKQVSEVLYQGRLWFELLGIGLLVPATEEMIFRGLLYSRFREFLGPVVSGVTTSLAFALFHGNLVQGVYAFFIGAALCLVYERYHSFWAPYILHATANVVSVIATETPALNQFFVEGPVFYVTTAVCSVLVVLFVYLVDKKVMPQEQGVQRS